MGAEQFITRGKGRDAAEAFRAAVDAARYDRGHGGYTGTIAEKNSFGEVAVPDGVDPAAFARAALNYPNGLSGLESEELRRAIAAVSEQVDDKWGPAGCVRLDEGEFLFFGWASS